MTLGETLQNDFAFIAAASFDAVTVVATAQNEGRSSRTAARSPFLFGMMNSVPIKNTDLDRRFAIATVKSEILS